MERRVKKPWPALKHGAYSATAILPGEDPDEFKKLHDGLITELVPSGVLEEGICGEPGAAGVAQTTSFDVLEGRTCARALRGHSKSETA